MTEIPTTARYPANGNYNANINDISFITDIAKQVSRRLNRYISKNEQLFIINFIRNLDPILLANKPLNQNKRMIVDELYKQISTGNQPNKSNSIDIHEMLKQEIKKTKIDRTIKQHKMDTIEHLTNSDIALSSDGISYNQLIENMHIKRNYITLDTRYRVKSIGNNSTFKWDYIDNLSRAQGTFNTYGEIRNIISMRVSPIRIPYVTMADTDYKRITLNIDELSPQGYVGHENRRFHWTFRTTNDSNWIDLQPFNYNDGYYRFDKPITKIDSITISFGSPMHRIIFDADQMEYTITYGALVTTITTASAHNLTTGDIVYFDDFTTSTPTVDAETIAVINRESGHFITLTGANSFTIPIDTLGLAAVPVGQVVNVYFGSKRIFIEIEVAYLDTDITEA